MGVQRACQAVLWETVPGLLVQVAAEDDLITKRYVNIYLLYKQPLLGANTQKGAFGLPRGLSYPKGIALRKKKKIVNRSKPEQ